MRMLGAGCIAAASLSFGLLSLYEKRRRLRCLRAMGFALSLLAAELGSNRTPLPRLAAELSKRTERPASDFFAALSAGLARLGELDFYELWSAALAETLPELTAVERESLLEMGRHLGRFALDEQLRAIERSAAAFADALRREEASYRDDRRLRLALPAAAGAMLVILLL